MHQCHYPHDLSQNVHPRHPSVCYRSQYRQWFHRRHSRVHMVRHFAYFRFEYQVFFNTVHVILFLLLGYFLQKRRFWSKRSPKRRPVTKTEISVLERTSGNSGMSMSLYRLLPVNYQVLLTVKQSTLKAFYDVKSDSKKLVARKMETLLRNRS